MSAVKQLYLCSSCKKTGVRSSKSKVFETFFCPTCKKDTTLFLPKNQLLKEETPVKPEENNIIPIFNFPKDYSVKIDSNKSGYSLRDVITFVTGFICALLVMKYK
jgi:hypothetical protein